MTNKIMGVKKFATSQYHDSVLNATRFMIDDIDKTSLDFEDIPAE